MLGTAIIADLTNGRAFFEEVAALADGPVITTLRALDIVAWHAGRRRIGPAIWAATSSSDTVPPETTEPPGADDDAPTSHPYDERP